MGATKTALVTGATGFIGKATVNALAGAGWKVTTGSRSGSTSRPDGAIHLDLERPETLLALEKLPPFDAIVHLGARVGWTGESDADLFVPNVLSTGCLAQLAGNWKAQLIFASATIVHGVRTEAIETGSPLCLDTPYAKSKWLAEQVIEASGASHCILRIAGVFGSEGPAHLSLNRSIDAARQGKLPVQIGSGKALRNYVYVKDVAEAVVHSLRGNLEGTHLLAGHEILTVSEMLRGLCDIFLPRQQPVMKDGPEASNQVIKPSALLPKTRSFREALADIQKGDGR